MTLPESTVQSGSIRSLQLGYPRWHSGLEFAQGALAVGLCTWLLIVFEPGYIFGAVLLLLLLGFAWFAYRAFRRWRFRAELRGDRIMSSDGSCVIDLSELTELSLAYYSTRRDGRSGWYRLKLKSSGERFEAESKMIGFDTLVETAARNAIRNDVPFDEASRDNLVQFVELPEPT